MRVAALAFGVLAGLVASLILALGGLDPDLLPRVDARQLHFALFVIANIGVFAAALALAAPLAAAILMLLAAAAWAGAAILLRHGPDYVLITPPALLAIGAAFAIIAFVLRPRALDSMPGIAMADEPRAAPAQLRGPEPQEQTRAESDWQPGRKRPAARQEPIFRDPDDDDEESGFARFVRGISTVLSFGLYAALAGAAVLVFLNLRTGDGAYSPVLEARSSSAASTAPTAPSSSAPPAAPVLTATSSSDPIAAVQTLLSAERERMADGTGTFRTAGPASASATEGAASLEPAPPPASDSSSAVFVSSGSSETLIQLEPQNLLADGSSSASLEPPADTSSSVAPVLPFAMPARMAAERQRPAPRPAAAAPASPAGGDIGL